MLSAPSQPLPRPRHEEGSESRRTPQLQFDLLDLQSQQQHVAGSEGAHLLAGLRTESVLSDCLRAAAGLVQAHMSMRADERSADTRLRPGAKGWRSLVPAPTDMGGRAASWHVVGGTPLMVHVLPAAGIFLWL